MAGMRKLGSTYTRMRFRRGLVILTYIAGLVALGSTLAALVAMQGIQTIAEIIQAPKQTSVNWTQFGYDATGTRHNPAESQIKVDNVARLHMTWRSKLPDVADSTPAFLHSLLFPDGNVRNVLYLTTKSGSLVALDADSGAILWRSSNPTYDPNKIPTSSPFADAEHSTVYSYGLDGAVHKYDAVTGREAHGGGWPVTIPPTPASEKQSSSLNAAN